MIFATLKRHFVFATKYPYVSFELEYIRDEYSNNIFGRIPALRLTDGHSRRLRY